jgi:hypothetical protein
MSRLARLSSALLCFPALLGAPASASVWVPIGGDTIIFVPVPSLDSVQTQAFNYGSDATLTLNGFGNTSAIYYQTQQWSGDTASGGFGTFGDWQCQSQTTLNANNNALKLALANGRYKVNVAAVMANDICDAQTLLDFKADKPISSADYINGQMVTTDQYKSAEFAVINESQLNETVGQIYLSQNDATRYDLQLKWPSLEGVSNYNLTLYKDNIPHSFTVKNTDLLSDSSFAIVDTFEPTTYQFSDYTGPAQYRFDVQYCLSGGCSALSSYASTLDVQQLQPSWFEVESADNSSSINAGEFRFQWWADLRHTKFRIIEQYRTIGGGSEPIFDFPRIGSVDKMVEPSTGRVRFTYTMPKALEGTYIYTIQSCDYACSETFSDGRYQDVHANGVHITPQTTEPVGLFDNYNPSSGQDTLTGFAADMNASIAADNTAGQTYAIVTANGQPILTNGVAHQLANAASSISHTNNGFVLTGMASKLSNTNGIDFNAPITLELYALQITSIHDNAAFLAQDPTNNTLVDLKTISSFNNQRPIAANDNFNFVLGTQPLMNLIANDYDPEGQGLQVLIQSWPKVSYRPSYRC